MWNNSCCLTSAKHNRQALVRPLFLVFAGGGVENDSPSRNQVSLLEHVTVIVALFGGT